MIPNGEKTSALQLGTCELVARGLERLAAIA